MNNPPLSREKTLQIFKHGVYYSPATKHYNTQNSNVVCDRCHTTNLDICIGYETYDICLSCIQEISKQLKRQKEIEKFPTCIYDTATYMSQSQFKPMTATNMEQAQFRPTYLTRMLQQAFRPGSKMYEDDDSDDESTKTFMVQSQFRN